MISTIPHGSAGNIRFASGNYFIYLNLVTLIWLCVLRWKPNWSITYQHEDFPKYTQWNKGLLGLTFTYEYGETSP